MPCEVCHGAQYNRETLDVHFKGRSIADVLGMTIEAGRGFLAEHAIAPGTSGRSMTWVWALETLYVLDEPTTGLRVEDVRTCWPCSTDFVDQGNTVVVIEHDLDVIKTAYWIVDMGPEGGHRGRTVIAEGARTGGGPASVLHRAVPPTASGEELSAMETDTQAWELESPNPAAYADKDDDAPQLPGSPPAAPRSIRCATTSSRMARVSLLDAGGGAGEADRGGSVRRSEG